MPNVFLIGFSAFFHYKIFIPIILISMTNHVCRSATVDAIAPLLLHAKSTGHQVIWISINSVVIIFSLIIPSIVIITFGNSICFFVTFLGINALLSIPRCFLSSHKRLLILFEFSHHQ